MGRKGRLIGDLLKVIGILFLTGQFPDVAESLMCDRTTGMTVPRTLGNGNFEVIIHGGPGKYVPGAIYTVRIQGQGDPYGTEKFSRFLLVAEPALGNAGQVSAGNFRLKDDSLARFSEFCPNAVKHASEVPKSEVQVLWIAPPVSAGCVIFRATVVKNNQQWYMDDDDLTEELCPEDEAQEEDNLEPCTACDEAKYELTFEGIWSSLTHPRNFPLNLWTANFSDIIGASHGPHFRFWDYGKMATEGLRHVAEFGDSRVLEGELKEQSENIRTIIKARGLRHTNFNGLKTFAVFRADKNHNLISLISKIDPSPDWFVGVSGLNLCGKNGTWLVEKEINLFPIDAGTDSGASYMSPDTPTLPRAEIQRLVWSPNPESPFYDPDGNMLKPFAKLRLQQQRTYRRGSCDETFHPVGSNNDYGDDDFFDDSPDRDRPECAMQPWSPWSPCSPNCGKGSRKRTRRYVNEAVARQFGCDRRDSMEKICHNPQSCKGSFPGASTGSYEPSRVSPGTQDQLNAYNIDNRRPSYTESRNFYPGGSEGGRKTYPTGEDTGFGEPMGDFCGTTEWRPWSLCSDPCGTGVRIQLRSFHRPAQAKRHKCETHVKLKNMEKCPRTPECREPESPAKVEEGCEVTDWGPWRPCSVTCGKGVKTRDRLYKFSTFDHRKCTQPMQETVPCDGIQLHCPPERNTADCLEPRSEGACREKLMRWYFDRVKLRCQSFIYSGCKGTRNNFEGLRECELVCSSLNETLAEERSEIQAKYGVVLSSAFTYMMTADESSLDCDTFTNVPTRTRHSRPSGDNSVPYNQYAMGMQVNRQGPYSGIQSQGNAQRQPHVSSPTNSPSQTPHYHHHHPYGPQPNQPSYSDGPSIDCKLSAWSRWSGCSVGCGRGWKYQSRYVEVFNENGGRPCSPLMERSQRCKGVNCPRNSPHHTSNRMGHHSMVDDYNYQE